MSHRIHCDGCDEVLVGPNARSSEQVFYRVDMQAQKATGAIGNTEQMHLCSDCFTQMRTNTFMGGGAWKPS